VCDIVYKRKYKLLSSNRSILPYLYLANISILSWARGDYFWNIPRHDTDVLTKMVYIISYSSHLNKKYSERIFITYSFQYRIKQTSCLHQQKEYMIPFLLKMSIYTECRQGLIRTYLAYPKICLQTTWAIR
jgi:hypothetical protein